MRQPPATAHSTPASTPARTRVTLPQLQAKAARGEPITWPTCYDYPTAVMQDAAGVDMILVGDSLGMTMLGFDSTLPVTMDDVVRHTAAVRRGAPNAWLIGDMPYMSYQPSVETAIRNAGRLMAETGCDAVKLEGGAEMADRVEGIAAAGIPVMGHLGLTPRSAGSLGGYKVQGRDALRARGIVETRGSWRRRASSRSSWSWCRTAWRRWSPSEARAPSSWASAPGRTSTASS
jgi:3-methyl-2-oxobutanoate hydroxymethyltransferase